MNVITAQTDKRPLKDRAVVKIVMPARILQTFNAYYAEKEHHQMRDRAVVTYVLSASILILKT
jgi:hypothetical protein